MKRTAMARKSRHARPTRRSGGFFRGLATGLAVALAVQIHHAGLPDWIGPTPEEPSEAASPIEPSNTNFDFYRLLPTTEVRVEESELSGEGAPAAPQAASRPSTPTTQPTPAPATAPAPEGASYRVQVGSFRDRREADRLRASLALNGFESRIVIRRTSDSTWHRVVLGPFRLRKAAEEAKARVLASRGIDAQIVREES